MKSHFSIGLQALVVMAIVLLAFKLASMASESEAIISIITSYGYIGILFLSIISGFNLAVPIPIVTFVPLFIESGLSMTLTVLIISIGMTIGDMFGFLLGKLGRNATNVETVKFFRKVEKLGERHYLLPIVAMFFYASIMPFPNEVLVIPLAFLGYKVRHVFIAVLLGNMIFNTLVGFGLTELFIFL